MKTRFRGEDMSGKFEYKSFADINLNDNFFDSLKLDYPGFDEWFIRKAKEDRKAFVLEDELGIAAFVASKPENEEIITNRGVLPEMDRLKICTLKISDRHQGERYGEGAIGLMLWTWQKSNCNQIYVTVFDKHESLINQLKKFGFVKTGYNQNGEGIYLRDKRSIDYSDAYKSFPFINPGFEHAGIILIDDSYHDTMFAYSELANGKMLRTEIEKNVTNGLTKIYVGSAYGVNHYIGEPVLIYRKDTSDTKGRGFRSCITSFAIVNDIIMAKQNGIPNFSFEKLLERIKNKSIFDETELYERYTKDRNLQIIELIYYGFFGSGNNVNYFWLNDNGMWSEKCQYPTEKQYSIDEFKTILSEGKVNVSNVIIN